MVVILWANVFVFSKFLGFNYFTRWSLIPKSFWDILFFLSFGLNTFFTSFKPTHMLVLTKDINYSKLKSIYII